MTYAAIRDPVSAIRKTSPQSGQHPGQYSARVSALILLAPALGLCLAFIFIPAVMAVAGSFFTFGITSRTWEPAGLSNYVSIAHDPVFWISLRNNLIIILGSIVIQVGFGTVLAAILDRGIPRMATVFRTIIFAPMVVSAVAVALVWKVILDPNVGALNAIVKAAGLTPPMLGWLGDPSISIWVVLMIGCWQYTGFMMVLILAGLQGIPKELYEAAALDGAKGLTAFRHITLPSLRNVLIVAVLITIIGGLKVFDLIFVTTQGGPANATQVLGTYIYLQAFNLGNMGYASALSVVLLIMAVVLGWFQLKTSRRA